MSIKFLDDGAIRNLAPMSAVIGAVKSALVGMLKGEFELPQRLAGGGGSSLVMPIFHGPTSSSVTKILSLDPARDPFINGVVVWTANGLVDPIVADAVTITTLRTGAITGAAADLLAGADAATMTIFGAGAQAFDQVRAILAVRDIKEVTVVSRNGERAASTASVLSREYPGVTFKATTNGRDTLGDADIVVCATTATAPLFTVDELGENTFVSAIGSYRPDMHEFPQELLAGCPVYVDSVEACMHESGELIRAVESNILKVSDLVPLGRALVDESSRRGRAVFKSVGIAAQDWAAMKVLSDELARRDPVSN